jgi:hypothetical protein
MARDPRDLRRLVEELVALARRSARASSTSRRIPDRFRAPPKDFKVPVLTGGTRWIGGDLRREDIYGDDGR